MSCRKADDSYLQGAFGMARLSSDFPGARRRYLTSSQVTKWARNVNFAYDTITINLLAHSLEFSGLFWKTISGVFLKDAGCSSSLTKTTMMTTDRFTNG